ncbi:MAG: LacI family transcriptional regulator [Verrucomicrobiales bacterium]|jgi:LacI family transcriptional regulator|nr:LacI family transcriptional regulator [Verrucomicrobiales bacterium]
MIPAGSHKEDRKRFVSMADIAKKAGVSKNTVSLALRKDSRVSSKTSQKIIHIANQLGYQKNPTMAHLLVELRKARSPSFKATLALFNANKDLQAFLRHPTIPSYVAGCRRRAAQLGYALDEFWLYDPNLQGNTLNRIMTSRNIRGAVVIGEMWNNHLPEKFMCIWENFPCVVTGVRTHNPTLSFACVDHHALAMQAVEQAIRLGYKRPAIVIDQIIDQLVEGRFTAGVYIAQQQLAPSSRTRPFLRVNQAQKDISLFKTWLRKERPDVILTLYNATRHWLESLNIQIPQDIGLIQLEWRQQKPEWAGMDQHNDLVGEAALDMVIEMIHRNERGIPSSPRATLIGGTWVNGITAVVQE